MARGTFFLGSDCDSVDVCRDGSVLVSSTAGVVRRLVLDASGNLSDTGESLAVDSPQNVTCAPDSPTPGCPPALGLATMVWSKASIGTQLPLCR